MITGKGNADEDEYPKRLSETERVHHPPIGGMTSKTHPHDGLRFSHTEATRNDENKTDQEGLLAHLYHDIIQIP